jgi:hypothetical protein
MSKNYKCVAVIIIIMILAVTITGCGNRSSSEVKLLTGIDGKTAVALTKNAKTQSEYLSIIPDVQHIKDNIVNVPDGFVYWGSTFKNRYIVFIDSDKNLMSIYDTQNKQWQVQSVSLLPFISNSVNTDTIKDIRVSSVFLSNGQVAVTFAMNNNKFRKILDIHQNSIIGSYFVVYDINSKQFIYIKPVLIALDNIVKSVPEVTVLRILYYDYSKGFIVSTSNKDINPIIYATDFFTDTSSIMQLQVSYNSKQIDNFYNTGLTNNVPYIISDGAVLIGMPDKITVSYLHGIANVNSDNISVVGKYMVVYDPYRLTITVYEGNSKLYSINNALVHPIFANETLFTIQNNNLILNKLGNSDITNIAKVNDPKNIGFISFDCKDYAVNVLYGNGKLMQYSVSKFKDSISDLPVIEISNNIGINLFVNKNSPSYFIATGKVYACSGIKNVIVQGKHVKIDKNGSFTANVSIEKGKTGIIQITITADSNLNSMSDAVIILNVHNQ